MKGEGASTRKLLHMLKTEGRRGGKIKGGGVWTVWGKMEEKRREKKIMLL